MKIMIVGTGSLGSEIAYTFYDKHKITCIDHGKDFDVLKRKLPKVTFVKGDTHDSALVHSKTKEIDIIFYCIDTGGIVNCLNSPQKYTKINVDEFQKFLSAIDDIDKKQFFLFSSCYVYPDIEYITEYTPTNPESLYGKLRLLQEEILKNITKNYIILRLSNIFGYGHFFNVGNTGAIEKFIDCVFTGQKIKLHGDGSQLVDYLYKSDLMSLLQILLKNPLAKIYNVSTGISKSIQDIANLVNQIAFLEYGKNVEIMKMDTGERLPNSPRISPNKIMNEISWRPSLNIDSRIREMMNIYSKES